MAQRIKQSSPQDVRDIEKEIKKFYDTEDGQGRKNWQCPLWYLRIL